MGRLAFGSANSAEAACGRHCPFGRTGKAGSGRTEGGSRSAPLGLPSHRPAGARS